MSTLTIDLAGIGTKAALHQRLKEQLHFPDWYGPSWDALFDRLLAQPGMPDELRLVHWQEFGAACPRELATLRRLAADYAAERPGRRLVLAGSTDEL